MMRSISLSEMKEKSQWVCWRLEDRDGNRVKVPKNPHNGYNAKPNDPSTWGTYEECLEGQRRYICDGIGIMLADGLCGIDIDAINHGTISESINPLEKEICKIFEGTYMEYSPSGNGIHILGMCDINQLPFVTMQDEKTKIDTKYYSKNPNNNLEMYIAGTTNRFFTFTEELLGTNYFNNITEEMRMFAEIYMRRNDIKEDEYQLDIETKMEEILSLARNSKNGRKFIKLYYDGDISDYNYDESSADLALCDLLAFWTKKDKELIDKLFRNSRLYRPKWERADYRQMTIDTACANVTEVYNDSESDNDEKTRELTLDILNEWLHQNGISIRSNEITHEIEVSGFDAKYNPLTICEQMHVIVHDAIKAKWHCNKNLVQDLLAVISQINRYNPVLDILADAMPWDGKDRLEELFSIIHIDKEDTLSRTLIHKWLMQTLSLAHNSYPKGFGADGVLVFQGAQGIGKTSLCRQLGVKSELTKTGLYIDSGDKDTLIRSTSCWVGELGELETTLRSDMARLKGFITAEVDRYRVPYGRGDVTYPRRTSFIATCNSTEFLADESGSRRFWVIPCKERFDLIALNNFDALQLWKQIEFEIKSSNKSFADCFRLTADEQKLLAERNAKFNRKVKAQNEIEDILADAEVNPHYYEFKWATPTKFRMAYDFLRQYSSENIGRALSALNLDERAMRLDGSKSVSKGCRYLPFPKSSSGLGNINEFDLQSNYVKNTDDEPF